MILQSSFCLAIAEVYTDEGKEAFLKKDYNNAVYFFTGGIKVNCRNEDVLAVLYSNRAYANLKLGELVCVSFWQILGRQHGQQVVTR